MLINIIKQRGWLEPGEPLPGPETHGYYPEDGSRRCIGVMKDRDELKLKFYGKVLSKDYDYQETLKRIWLDKLASKISGVLMA